MFPEGHPAKVVPSKLTELWRPLIRIIDRYRCTPLLVSELVSELGTEDSQRNNWLTRWICTLILSMSHTTGTSLESTSLTT